jgi:hypothetical protein
MKSLALRLLPAIVLALVASSCASAPRASVQADKQAKTFETRPDQCGLYVYRNESLGAAVSLQLDLDGKRIGATSAKTFFFAWLEPGPHTLLSHGESKSELAIDAQAGKLLFVWQEVKWGFMTAGSKLHLVPEAEGKQGVLECELAASAP